MNTYISNPESSDPLSPNIYSAICPSRHLLSRVGDKWSVMILLLLAESPLRFGAIKRSCEGVSQKMLTHTLRQLESDQLLIRTVLQEKPLQVEYRLSELGEGLAVHLRPLVDWVHQNYPQTQVSQS